MSETKFEDTLVISSTRRNATVLIPPNTIIKARIGSKIDTVTIGDQVKLKYDQLKYFITSVSEPKNSLSRTIASKTKKIVNNLDRLLLVSAVEPLFNTAFNDRVLLVCSLQKIPVTLIVNKTDLGLEQTQHLIDIYSSFNLPIILTSTKTKNGITALKEFLDSTDENIVALAGVSGVGKSSLLNCLIPMANRQTGDVSRKTGKGTQTTSLAHGYLYHRQQASELILVDLPGIQNFGVSNYSIRDVAAAFPEFVKFSTGCEYYDCQHTAEPTCGVKTALEEGLIAPSRYLSYLGILEEIESNRPY